MLPLLFAAVRGEVQTSTALAAAVVGGALGGMVIGLLRDRLGRAGSRASVVLLVASLAAAVLAIGSGLWPLAAALIAACWAGGVTSSWTSTFECFGTRNAGTNFGLVTTGWFGGLAVGATWALSALGGAPVAERPIAGWQAAIAVGSWSGVLVYLSTLVHPAAPAPHPRSTRRPRPS